MRNLTIYLALLLCLLASKMVAQESFESKARVIANKIEKITKEEKEALKIEVEEVNVQFEKGTITKAQADQKKQDLAQARATIIENKVAVAQEELKDLVQQKVNGKIRSSENATNSNDSLSHNEKRYFISFKVKDSTYIDADGIKRKYKRNSERRTTSQLVLAYGLNNLETNGSIANSDFAYLRSVFFEWGITHNYRLLKNDNLLHLKYGFSWVYNHLNATDNRYFVTSGNQTNLQTYPTHLRKKDTYFRNVFVTIPVHLEFDFSKTKLDKDGKNIFKSHNGVRLGIGGFVGYNTNSKQFLSYEENGNRIKERQKGDWNINDWNYGLSSYIGYKSTSLYLKYDLNPMFADNAIKQNNISLGVRFDFN